MKATVAEFDKTVDADNSTITRLKRLRAKAMKKLKTWRRSHDHTPASASKTKSALRDAKRTTTQASVNLDETLTYIKELEKKNKVLQKKRNEAHRLIIALSNELKNLEIDTIRPEREKAILNLDLNEVARRRDAILTKTLEDSEADVTMKKASDEKEKDMKKKEFSAAQTSNRRARASVTLADRARSVQMYFRKRFTILFEILSYLSNKSEFSWDDLSDFENELTRWSIDWRLWLEELTTR